LTPDRRPGWSCWLAADQQPEAAGGRVRGGCYRPRGCWRRCGQPARRLGGEVPSWRSRTRQRMVAAHTRRLVAAGMGCRRLPTERRVAARGTDELFGDVGLATQPGKPQRPIHRHHRLPPRQPLAHDRDALAVGGGLLLQHPGRQQVQPSAHLLVGQVGVGTAAAGALGQAARAQQHREQALDPGERWLGAAAEGTTVRQHASPTEANKRSNRGYTTRGASTSHRSSACEALKVDHASTVRPAALIARAGRSPWWCPPVP
jgi:hypothetical protein